MYSMYCLAYRIQDWRACGRPRGPSAARFRGGFPTLAMGAVEQKHIYIYIHTHIYIYIYITSYIKNTRILSRFKQYFLNTNHVLSICSQIQHTSHTYCLRHNTRLKHIILSIIDPTLSSTTLSATLSTTS